MPLPENKTKTKDIGSVSTTFQGLDTQSYLFSQASRSGSSKDSSLDAVVGTIKKLYQDIDEARALASMERISDLPGRGHYERSERQHHMIPLSKLFDSLSSERMISTEAMIITSRSADTSRQPLKLLPSSGVDKRSTFSHENVARAYQPPTCSPRLTMTYKNKAASQLGGVGNPLLISTAARTQLSKLAQSALMDVDNADDNSTHTFILSSTRSWSSNSDTYTSETI
ncbi:hypothetical protein BC829DRAFT_389981 [Chytridium lagenaria]|nr:hypothetical protein BC829DRAFT_389981 [Chytridium lagenaria]